MSEPRPVYCGFGDSRHSAAYAVDSRPGNPVRRHCVTCAGHLPKAKRWAGAGSTAEPLEGHEPPPEQQALF
jgi:hypothetical protein